MRRIAVINQKGGVGKTTTTANLGAALAQQGRRVVVVDMDAQANLSMSLGVEVPSDAPSTYSVLSGSTRFGEALRPTAIDGLMLLPSNIDLSGAELELASAIGREFLMRDALREWESEHRQRVGRAPADYVIFDCPPSLGLLSINALAAAGEVLITLQTEFLALQGMSKLVEVVQLLRRRLNPELVISGILPCLYDSRLKLAREVLGEIRSFFPDKVFAHPVRSNVKLAEAPSYGKTIFEYAPDSNGALDYRLVARSVIEQEASDPDLAALPPFDERSLTAATRSFAQPGANEPPQADSEPLAVRTRKLARAASIQPASDRLEPKVDEAPQREASTVARAVLDVVVDDEALANAAAAATDLVSSTDVVIQAGVIDDADVIDADDGNGGGGANGVSGPNAERGVGAETDVGIASVATSEIETSLESPLGELREYELASMRAYTPDAEYARNAPRPEELPALPPDAFEILTSYVHDR